MIRRNATRVRPSQRSRRLEDQLATEIRRDLEALQAQRDSMDPVEYERRARDLAIQAWVVSR